MALKSLPLSPDPWDADSSSDQIAFSPKIGQSDAVILLPLRFAARFRAFPVTRNKNLNHARSNKSNSLKISKGKRCLGSQMFM